MSTRMKLPGPHEPKKLAFPDDVVRTITIHGVTYKEDDVEHALSCYLALVGALEQAAQMIEVALPRFNWGASALTSEAIDLLNRTPIAIRLALSKAHRT